MKNPTDVFSGIFLLVICGIGAYSISSLPDPTHYELYGPASFPKLILILLTLCSIFLLVKGIIAAPEKPYWTDPKVLKKLATFLLLIYAYLGSLTYLANLFFSLEDFYVLPGTGFAITTILFLLIAFPLLGRRNKREIVLVTVITTSILVAVFGIFFKVLLP